MPPEYIREQILSVKYDVFSFGVLLLEIISGKRVNVDVFSQHGRSDHLLTHVRILLHELFIYILTALEHKVLAF